MRRWLYASVRWQVSAPGYGPFQEFDGEGWRALDLTEVKDVHVPRSTLLRLHAVAAWQLRAEPGTGPSTGGQRVPFVIGIADGVPVGMSMLVRLLELLISHWPERHAVELVTTDGDVGLDGVIEVWQRPGVGAHRRPPSRSPGRS